MFSQLNGPSVQSMRQGAMQLAAHQRAIEVMHPKYEAFIQETANKVISHFADFKTCLKNAATAYQDENKDKIFRKAGRARAQKLKDSLDEAKADTLDNIAVLKETFAAGNENPDSLKTFLYVAINSTFCGNQTSTFRGYPLNKSMTGFLNDLCTGIEKALTIQLQPLQKKV